MQLVRQLQDTDVDGMWFQKDDGQETIQLLHDSFPSRVISVFGYQNWSLDFFLLIFFEVQGLCQETHDHLRLKGEI